MAPTIAPRTTRRRRLRLSEKAWDKFLAAFAQSGNVTLAARAAGLGRRSVYDKLRSDGAFKDAFKEAQDSAVDLLEAEAWRRAVEGVPVPVIRAGKLVSHVRRYSDSLLLALLRAHRPEKYRERAEAPAAGDPSKEGESARERLARRIAELSAANAAERGAPRDERGGSGGA